MKQFQINYEHNANLINDIRRIKHWCNSSVVSKVLFQVYIEKLDKEMIKEITECIIHEMPDALYMGCTTNGNIIMGEYANTPVSIVCTVFEDVTTQVELYQFKLDTESEPETARAVVQLVNDRPWVKAVMMNLTIRDMSMTQFCEDLSAIREGVEVFGGGAFSEDMNDNVAYVYSSAGELSDHSAVFALLGGDDFHVKTTFITGWMPLGREFQVTKADGFTLYEIDNEPAFEKYHRYLNIENDENFFTNSLEFPFFYEHNGINILRAPVACDENGALTMTADMDEDVRAQVAYGDPETILSSVKKGAAEFCDFIPDVINVYSCAARRTFWGADEISGESLPFESVAPTSGFYTSGEFLRTDDNVNQHNVTLVVAALREGGIEEKLKPELVVEEKNLSGKVSMINRLASFIQAATKELEIAAKTDALTGLLNRGEIQKVITRQWAFCKKNDNGDGIVNEGDVCEMCALIMMDIDDFKQVNDRYGHQEGDEVLQGLARMLQKVSEEMCPRASIGRWGGEEFMVMIPGMMAGTAEKIAEEYRRKFNEIDFKEAGRQTISLGVTQLHGGEDADVACMRVDEALYKAKKSGKDRTIVIV